MTVDKRGVLSRLFAFVGLGNISLLGNPQFALYTTLFVTVWFLMGFYMLIFIGGLQDIPKDYYEKIFEKFGVVEAMQVGARRSTGLGLTFCKLAVEAHGGRIGVKSEVAQGCTFWFALPRNEA